MAQQDVYRKIRRRAVDAGLGTKICCHSFRATGLYDRRNDQVSLDEVERILI